MRTNLKAPRLGPLLHGAAVFLAIDGYAISKYLYDALLARREGAEFDLEVFLIGLGMTAIAVAVSYGRNHGGVSITTDEGTVVKAATAAETDSTAVLTVARRVVPTNEQVIVLRDRPTVAPTANEVAAELTSGP